MRSPRLVGPTRTLPVTARPTTFCVPPPGKISRLGGVGAEPPVLTIRLPVRAAGPVGAGPPATDSRTAGTFAPAVSPRTSLAASTRAAAVSVPCGRFRASVSPGPPVAEPGRTVSMRLPVMPSPSGVEARGACTHACKVAGSRPAGHG